MQARLKTAVQHVWQYTGTEPLAFAPAWVRACTEMRADGLYFVPRTGKQLVKLGEWLLQDLDGEPTWSSDRDFQRQYEMVA